MKRIFIILISVMVLMPHLSYAQKSSAKMIGKALAGTFIIGVEKIRERDEQPLAQLGIAGQAESAPKAYSAAFNFTGFSMAGSGFGILENGKLYVITNAHVVDHADESKPITCITVDNTEYTSELVGLDNYYDVAVLKVLEKPGKEVVPLTIAKDVSIGEPVYALGSPWAHGDVYQFSVTDGIVSAINRRLSGLYGRQDYIQHTAFLAHGNSGGPLINNAGKVVGLNTSGILDVPQFNFALMGARLQKVVAEIIKHGSVQRTYIGVHFATRLKIIKSIFDGDRVEKTTDLPLIEALINDSPGSKVLADVVGHEVVAVNNQKIRSLGDIAAVLEDANPNSAVSIEVRLSNGRTKTLSIRSEKLGEKQLEAIAKYVIAKYSNIGELAKPQDKLRVSDVQKGRYYNDEYSLGDEIWAAGDYSEEYAPDGNMWRVSSISDLGKVIRLCARQGYFFVTISRGMKPQQIGFTIAPDKNSMILSHFN